MSQNETEEDKWTFGTFINYFWPTYSEDDKEVLLIDYNDIHTALGDITTAYEEEIRLIKNKKIINTFVVIKTECEELL